MIKQPVMKKYTSKRLKRVVGVNDFTLTTNKTNVSKGRFSCKLILVDENTKVTVFNRTIFVDFMQTISSADFVKFNFAIFSTLIIYSNLHNFC